MSAGEAAWRAWALGMTPGPELELELKLVLEMELQLGLGRELACLRIVKRRDHQALKQAWRRVWERALKAREPALAFLGVQEELELALQGRAVVQQGQSRW